MAVDSPYVREVLDGIVETIQRNIPAVMAQKRELGGVELKSPAVIEISSNFLTETRLPYVAVTVSGATTDADWMTPQRDVTIPLAVVVVDHGIDIADSDRRAWEWCRIIDLCLGCTTLRQSVPGIMSYHTRQTFIETPRPEEDVFRRLSYVFADVMLRTSKPS